MMARPKVKRDIKDIRKAVEMYIAGDKMQNIASHFNVSQPTVSYWVRKHGPKINPEGCKNALRTQGRRLDYQPDPEQAEIVFMVAAGVPAAHVAANTNPPMKRQRVSFIVKKWLDRGYVPPYMFEPGQVVRLGENGKERFYIRYVDWAKGTVVRLRDENGKRCPPKEIVGFRWYQKSVLCEVVNDTPASEIECAANAKTV